MFFMYFFKIYEDADLKRCLGVVVYVVSRAVGSEIGTVEAEAMSARIAD